MTRSNGQEDSMPIGVPAYLRALDSNGRPVRVPPSDLPVTASGGTASATASSRFGQFISPQDLGAVGDGLTDDTVAFQAAIDLVNTSGGGYVRLYGKYLVSNLDVKDGVSIVGPLGHPGEIQPYTAANYQSMVGAIRISGTITLRDSASIRGCILCASNLTMPFASQAAATAAIAAFTGTAITITGIDAKCEDLYILGFARAIDGTGCDRAVIENIIGDNTAGIRLTFVADVPKVNKCHFWPFLVTRATPWSPTAAQLQRSGVAFEFRDIGDWNKVTDCFSYGYATGYLINNCDDLTLLNCGADNQLTSTATGISIQGTSNECRVIGGQVAAHQYAYVVNSTGGNHQLVGCNAWNTSNTVITITSGSAVVVGGVFRLGAFGVSIPGASSYITMVGATFDSVTTPILIDATSLRSCNIAEDNVYINCTAFEPALRNQSVVQYYAASDASGASRTLRKSRGTAASPAIVQNNDYLGQVVAEGYDGSAFRGAALIRVAVDGTPGSGDMPGRIEFWTVPDGSTTPAKRMSINNAGNTAFGSITAAYFVHVNGTFGFKPGASVNPSNNGDVVFELTSNTTLTVKARGSDGVSRSGTITLA